MCLLLSRKGGSPELNEAWLKDFFTKNDDGFGFMYALDGKLHVDKSLGKVGEFVDKWRQLEALGHDFVCHLRMRTHGDISLENCHPYQVLDGSHGIEMWMAHNGVLSNGNSSDTTKSDTWHFIKDYLRPLLDPAVGGNPDLIYTPQFKAILGSAIGGSNKLIFLDNLGRLSTINKPSGREWNGMWLSNTYAWSASDAKDEKSLPIPYKYGRGGTTYETGGYEGYTGAGNTTGSWVKGRFIRYDSPDHPDYKEAGNKADQKKPGESNGNVTDINAAKNSAQTTGGGKPSQSGIQFTDDDDDDTNKLVTTSDLFQVLKQAGLTVAHDRITFASMGAFIKHFEVQVVLDLIELVHAEVISESVLCNCMVDYKLAREVLNDGYPPEDTVRRKIDDDVKASLEEAEAFDAKQKEAERLRASDPVIAAAAAASTKHNLLTAAEVAEMEAAKAEADRAIAAAKVSAELSTIAAEETPPPVLPVIEPKEIAEMGNKIADVAKSLEEEPVSAEELATEQHLAESEAAAMLAGSPIGGAE